MNKEELKLKIDKVIEGIAKDSSVYIQYWGEDDGRFIYDISIGRSSITVDYKHGLYTIYMCHSDYSEMYRPYKTSNIRDFKATLCGLINKAIKEHRYESRMFLEYIAAEIEKQTGMGWNYIGEDNDSLTIDFDCNVSYMKNLSGKGLQFTLDPGNGKDVICIVENNEKLFVNKVVHEYKKIASIKEKKNNRYTKTTPNKEIIARARELVKSRKSGTIRLYEDNCWWADVEYFSNGNYRFWVGYEDKRNGNSNGSIFTIYDIPTERYSCEFKVKENIKKKIFSTAVSLKKHV